MTLTGLSLARHVALPDHGVGLDGQSCSCLIVGWPVGLSSPTLGVGRPSVMFLFDCWPVGRPMLRTVRGCYSRGHSYFIVRGEILGFMKDEQLRKHLPRMFSLIKNESQGIEED